MPIIMDTNLNMAVEMSEETLPLFDKKKFVLQI